MLLLLQTQLGVQPVSVLGVQLSALCQSQPGLGLSSRDTELAGAD